LSEFRKYGHPPLRVILVHGGPGAVGEMSPVAKHLANKFGVVESLNKALTIGGQLHELMECVAICKEVKPIIVGFSWGAWLSILFATRYPDRLSKLILIGCGPLEEQYAQEIHKTRINRLEAKQHKEFFSLLSEIEKNNVANRKAAFKKLSFLVSLSDSYDPSEDIEEEIEIHPEVYFSVWNEASELRKNGQLLDSLNRITCPVVAIHGDYDPHPSEGVRVPLEQSPCNHQFELVTNCGHKPWIEKQAQDKFYQVLHKHLL